jgi:hypothetical protein
MLWELTGSARLARLITVVLLAGCGGRASSANADEGGAGRASGDAGSGALPGSGASAIGGDSSSHPGKTGAGGKTASAGSASANGGTNTAGTPQGAGANAGGASPTGGNTAAGNAAAGNATAGNATAGAGGASPSVAAACQSMCSGLSECPDGDGGFHQPCQDDCLTVADVQAADCKAYALTMLSCLTTEMGKNRDCATRFNTARMSCYDSIATYFSCAAVIGHKPPTMTLCAHNADSGSEGGKSRCMEDLKCLNDGLIKDLACREAETGKSDCSCYAKGSRTDINVNEATPEMCSERFAECLESGTLTP